MAVSVRWSISNESSIHKDRHLYGGVKRVMCHHNQLIGGIQDCHMPVLDGLETT